METLTIGSVKVHQLPEVEYTVKYKSKRKIDEKVADGASDATATDKGREVRDITIHLRWPDVARVNKVMGPVLKKLSPGGPDGGKPFEFAHTRNGLDLGEINAVRSILVKDCTGPDCEAGSGINTVEYGCDSWSAPAVKPGAAGKTPDKAEEKKADENPFGAVEPTPAGQIAQEPPTVKP